MALQFDTLQHSPEPYALTPEPCGYGLANMGRGAFGGGSMFQRFIWEEPYDSCYWGQAWAFQRPGRLYITEDWGQWP